MSGGYFDYAQYRIAEISDSIERLISSNKDTTLNEWGSKRGRDYSEETILEFKRGLVFLKLAEIYAQRIDWLVSGDDGEDSFHRRISEDINELLASNAEINKDLGALIEAASSAVCSYYRGYNLDEMKELQRTVELAKKWFPQKQPSTVSGGCRTCGIGADGNPYGYVCARDDCPTKITCTS